MALQDEPKRRLQPISIPPATPQPASGASTGTSLTRSKGSKQYPKGEKLTRVADQDTRSMEATPLTPSNEQDVSCPPRSDSNKSRTSAVTAFGSLRERARSSPRKSDQSSMGNSHRGSTTRSRHSDRSHRAAIAEQANLEEKTSRAQIESETERKLFKLMGQVPPTPISGQVNKNEIFVRTDDLRGQCRTVSVEKRHGSDEPMRSPRKKLFSTIRNPFAKTVSNAAAPQMPSKAAQVLGTSARKPQVVEVRPIKPAHPLRTPPKVIRSDTAKSLPMKIMDPEDYARRHRRSASKHRSRNTGRSSAEGSGRSSNAENNPPVLLVGSSSETTLPPTPPAKDTPPRPTSSPAPQSPLRRAAPTHDLRGSFEAYKPNSIQMRLPAFAMSPTPSNMNTPRNIAWRPNSFSSPTKSHLCTTEECIKSPDGDAMRWLKVEESANETQPRHERSSLPPVKTIAALKEVSRIKNWNDEVQGAIRKSEIPPQFFSPSDRSVRLPAAGESPSENSNTQHFLRAKSPSRSLLYLREDSNNESIEMMFKGDANEIDPQSSTADLINKKEGEAPSPEDHERKPVIESTPNRIDGQAEPGPPSNSITDYLQPEQSSASLTDILNGFSLRGGADDNFHPKYPSAVPSPLHRMPDSMHSMPPYMTFSRPHGPWVQPFKPRTLDDYFLMVNEHLDVVGKTTWDLFERNVHHKQTEHDAKYDQLVGIGEKRAEEIKSLIKSLDEKVESIAEGQKTMHKDLKEILGSIKTGKHSAQATQDQYANQFDAQIKELHAAVQSLYKLEEQRAKNSEYVQRQNGETFLTPGTHDAPVAGPAHRSQPSLGGFYNNSQDFGREMQPPGPSGFAASPVTTHGSTRGGYGNGHGYGQQWGQRAGYHSRHGREHYAGPSLYQYANNGGFSNGYNGNLIGSNGAPNSPEPHYGFNQNSGK